MPAHLPEPPAVAPDWALFLDVDGTLLEFADAPGDVLVQPELIDVLAVLHGRLDGALALVSGRTLAQLDELFAPLHLPAAGLHGLEHRDDGHISRDARPPVARTSRSSSATRAEISAELRARGVDLGRRAVR